jgi:hypothetical protein
MAELYRQNPDERKRNSAASNPVEPSTPTHTRPHLGGGGGNSEIGLSAIVAFCRRTSLA